MSDEDEDTTTVCWLCAGFGYYNNVDEEGNGGKVECEICNGEGELDV